MAPSPTSPGRPRGALLAAALAALAAAPPARAEAPEPPPPWLDLWVEAGAGADGNPRREAGVARSPSGFTSLLGRARARLAGERTALTLTLTEAGRLYPAAEGADALASRLEAAARAALGAGLTASASAAASDTTTRDGRLDRHALRADASLAWRAGPLQAAAAGGWSRFAPRERTLHPFRAEGPEAWLRLSCWPAAAHRLTAGAGRSVAGFPGWAAAGAPGAATRRDRAGHLAAEWSWRGEALAAAGWTYTRNESSAPGGDFTRHRLTASAALPLPADLTLAARLALQWSRYPDPLLLAAEQRLAEGQEALDQLEARLTRPLPGALEASLTLSWYRARGGAGVPAYERAVAAVGIGWRSAGVAP